MARPSRSKSPEVPDVFIDSTPEETPRLATLIRRLRDRDLDVDHFDDGLVASGRRTELASEYYRSVDVVLVPMGALREDRVRNRGIEALQRLHAAFQTAEATVFGLHLHDPGTLVTAGPELILELRTEQDLEAAIDTIVGRVRRMNASSSSPAQGAASSAGASRPSAPRASKSSASVRLDSAEPSGRKPGAVRLQMGNETGVEEWNVAPQLRGVLQSAARYWPRRSARERFTLSFKTLLLSLFNTADRWSIWARETGARTGFRAELVFEEQGLTRDEIAERSQPPLDVAEHSATVSATTSTSAILRSAREHANRTDSTLDVQHVLAAIVHDPAGHENELERWGFQPAAWSAALADEVAAHVPAQAEYFRTLHGRRFPTARAEPARVEEPARTTPTWRTEFWAEAHTDLQEALLLAHLLASQESPPTPVSPRHLLAGLVGRGASSPLAQAWNALFPPKPENASLRPSQLALASLGFPTTTLVLKPLSEAPEVDDDARRVLALARIDGASDGTGVALMDVFLALWTRADDGGPAIDAILRSRGIDPDAALASLSAHPALTSDAARLRALLDHRRAPVVWSRPEVRTDRVDGAVPFEDDMLDVGPAAKRFAKLLADKAVAPPIAVGLFGHWGSGKTFFMGLMRSHVQELMKAPSTRYARRVAQIEFNAWHYHDTNLWASLAIHIFDRLAHELGGTDVTQVEAARRKLHGKVSSSQTHRKEAQEQRNQALARRTAAAKTLEQKRRDRAEKERSSITRRFEIAWKAIEEGGGFAQLRKDAKALAEQFGIVELEGSIEGVQAVRADVEKTRAHALGLFTAIGRRFKDVPTGAKTVGFLLVAVLLALGLGWGTERAFEKLGMLAPRYSGTVMEIATMISVFAAWCGRRVRQLQSGLDGLSRVEADLAKAEKDIDATRHADLKALEVEIAALDKEILDADGKIAAADQEIAQAQAEIDRINRGGLVYDFLQQRRTSATYVGQLGLVSTIRKDLQDLDELLEDFAKNAKNAKAIDRILLYIDDLDRCHPDKVLEVLQAVHLLLTFDLFNVVVGVDARWLERSLRRQYEQKLGGRGLAADGFSPQDYLEKIFQIPFALGGMDSKGFQKFVGDMVETRSEWKQRMERDEEEKRERDAQHDKEAAAKAARAEAEERTHPASQRVATANAPEAPDTGSSSTADRELHGAPETNADTESVPVEGPTPKEPPQYLEDHEGTFLDALHPFIDRPRLAKRFVNIYKLLRVTAHDEGNGTRFSGTVESDEYRAALILLAIHIGHQRLSMRLVPALLAARSQATWSSVLEDLGDPMRDGAKLSIDERQELALVRAKLGRLEVTVPDGLAAYRHWASRVIQYSFEPMRFAYAPAVPAKGTTKPATVR
jgi:hypothetical protein